MNDHSVSHPIREKANTIVDYEKKRKDQLNKNSVMLCYI